MSDNHDPRVDGLAQAIRELDRRTSELEHEMAHLANAVTHGVNLLAHKLEEVRDSVNSRGGDVAGRIDSTNTHLLAANAGIIATNGSILLHKTAMEHRISIQTRAVVHMECIRAYNEAVGLRAKSLAFADEIDAQFDKAVEGIFFNRILYDKHFQAIHEEYDAKVRKIGEHIFEIWESDLRPAEQAAQVPHSAFQQLALEVDLERLARRSAQLDQDLGVVFERSLEPKLDMDRAFERDLSSTYSQTAPSPDGTRAAVAAVFLAGSTGDRVVMDRVAAPAGGRGTTSTGDGRSTAEVSTHPAKRYTTQAEAVAKTQFVERVARRARRRSMSVEEAAEFRAAIVRLNDRGLIPSALLPGFDTYLAKVPLQILEQQEVLV